MSFWNPLTTFTLTGDWQLSSPIVGNTFRLHHNLLANSNRYPLVAMIALACSTDEGMEIFNPQKISPKPELEIVQFPIPPAFWKYSFAIKQLLLPSQQLITWSVSVDMPLYNPGVPGVSTSSSATVSSVAVSTSNVLVLAANPARTGATVTNTSKSSSLYLELGSPASLTSYSVKILPGGYDEIPFNFTGILNGIWDKADSAGAAVVHEFSL